MNSTVRGRGRLEAVILPIVLALGISLSAVGPAAGQASGDRHDLVFSALPGSWDEGVPLGNGLLGALVWQKGGALRLSLDRADLWDLRPVKEFETTRFRFAWVKAQVANRDIGPVQDMVDLPYERDPAPTKIPAGAIEFDVAPLGDVASVRLALKDAVCEVRWKSGARMTVFVHAVQPVGWFKFEGVPASFAPRLIPPAFAPAEGAAAVTPGAPKTLASLGYPDPEVSGDANSARFRQRGWDGLSYDIAVEWKKSEAATLVGVWSIGARVPGREGGGEAATEVAAAWKRIAALDLDTHRAWWKLFWARSSVEVPDPVLEKQWYLETYKFGAASRRGAPPITLQAVWTADDGGLPPWKGDYHNDLNTELSYWPGYVANHLDESQAFVDWLWTIRSEAEKYTRTYFAAKGLNVPGVCTLTGQPMGGWTQYSLSPTVSAWLAQHFYLQWQFGRDQAFLADRAYPWVRDALAFIESIAIRRPDGKKQIPMSSSPEMNDNRLEAWFPDTTNFDLSLVRWLYTAAAEMAGALDKKGDRDRYVKALADWPDLARSADDGRLLVAPNVPLAASHRHFSHLMGIYPLGLVDWSAGDDDRRTIRASLADLDRLGPDAWCGYSYSWLGGLAARAMDGEKAAAALRTFAQCFCLPNSFHANGDQSKSGKSKFTYRPFTLEGNFAFAAGLQEMLVQSHTGTVRLFPAVPAAWTDAAFDMLRTYGAFLVSARRRAGSVSDVRAVSEAGGVFRLESPFGPALYDVTGVPEARVKRTGNLIEIEMNPGECAVLKAR